MLGPPQDMGYGGRVRHRPGVVGSGTCRSPGIQGGGGGAFLGWEDGPGVWGLEGIMGVQACADGVGILGVLRLPVSHPVATGGPPL